MLHAVLSVETLSRGKDHRIVGSLMVYPTAPRVTQPAEHRSKHRVRTTKNDIPYESKKKTDRGAIREMKMPSCEGITHLLKMARGTAELTSASRQAAYGKMTHKLRVGHSEVIIRDMAGSCGHATMLVLQ